MSPVYLVAFSGHRTEDQPGRTAAELTRSRILIEKSLCDLRAKAAQVGGEIHLACSAAEGADLIACEIAMEGLPDPSDPSKKIPIPLHLILPLNPEQFKQDFNDPGRMHSWNDVQEIIAHTQSGENNSTFRIANTSHLSPDCYHETNLQLLESADLLIALWNNIKSDSNSGTHAAWLAAESLDLPRIHINPADQSHHEFELEKFAPTNGPGLKIIRDLLPENVPTDCDLIKTLGVDLDKQASNSSRNTRKQTLITIILHGAASLLAAGGISYALAGGSEPLKVLPIVALLEFLLIGAAEIIHFRLHHHGEKWIRTRFAAELLRPLHLTLRHLDPLKPLVRDHQPDWHRFLLSIGLAQPCGRTSSLEEAKKEYRENRIEDQITHFSTKHDQAKPWAEGVFFAMRGAAWAALVVVFISMIVKFSHFNEAHLGFTPPLDFKSLTLYFLPVALPLIAGILLSYRLSFDLGRRKLRYPEMIANLERAKIDLENAHTPQALRQSHHPHRRNPPRRTQRIPHLPTNRL